VEIYEQTNHRIVQGIDVTKALNAAAVDPTGCGDAFRGGLLFGLAKGASLADSTCLGNTMGALKVIHRGGQNHTIDVQQVGHLLKTHYPDAAGRLLLS